MKIVLLRIVMVYFLVELTFVNNVFAKTITVKSDNSEEVAGNCETSTKVTQSLVIDEKLEGENLPLYNHIASLAHIAILDPDINNPAYIYSSDVFDVALLVMARNLNILSDDEYTQIVKQENTIKVPVSPKDATIITNAYVDQASSECGSKEHH